MEINRNYYGKDYNFPETLSGLEPHKIADFNLPENTWRTWINAQKYNDDVKGGEVIDRSIFFGEIGDGADIRNIGVLTADRIENPDYTVSWEAKYNAVNTNRLPFYLAASEGVGSYFEAPTLARFNPLFAYKNYFTTSTGVEFPKTWGQLSPDETYDGPISSADLELTPFTYINYKNLIFVAVVMCGSEGAQDYRMIDLLGYKRQGFRDYPLVYGIGLVPHSANTDGKMLPLVQQSGQEMALMTSIDVQLDNFEDPNAMISKLSGGFGKGSFFSIYSYDDLGYGHLIEDGCDNPIVMSGVMNYENNVYEWNNNHYSSYATPVYGPDNYITEFSTNTCKLYVKYKEDITEDNIDEFYDFAMSQCAYLGFWFTDSVSAIYNAYYQQLNWDSEALCLPIWNGGITTGQYTRGEDNQDNNAYDWENIHDNNYDPTIYDPIELNDYSYNILGSSGCGVYAIDSDNLKQFTKNVSYASQLGPVSKGDGHVIVPTSLRENSLIKAENPFDGIISLRFYPFSVSNTDSDILVYNGATVNVFDDYGQQIEGYEYVFGSSLSNSYTIIDFGYIYELMDPIIEENFWNYEPYTAMSLYIPFCGSVELLPSEWMGHKIGIKLIVDLITGNCLGCIFKDDSFILAKEGSCGIDVPITVQMKNNYKESLINEQLDYAKIREKQSIIGTGLNYAKTLASDAGNIAKSAIKSAFNPVGMAIGNIGNTINSFADLGQAALGVQSAITDYSHTKNVAGIERTYNASQPVTFGMPTNQCSSVAPTRALLYIKQVVPYEMDEYNEILLYHYSYDGFITKQILSTRGFAMNEIFLGNQLQTEVHADFTGKVFWQCSDVNFADFNATPKEKDMLRNILLTGFKRKY